MNLRHIDSPSSDRLRRPVGKIRVLVVEDDTSLRERIVKTLAEWGFSPHSAWSGEDAMRLNAAEAFDIAVLDLCLPGIDGIETLNRLRQNSPYLQGIVLTGSATIAAAKRAIHLDVVEFLTKPCHRGELERAIDRARRRLPDLLPTIADPPPSRPVKSNGSLEDVERRHIFAALRRNQGDRKSTAAELGITRKTLYNRIKQYAVQGFRADNGAGRSGA